MDFKNELLNNMFDKRWHSINLYHFLHKLTSDEITNLLNDIEYHGHSCYSGRAGEYNININLLLLLPIFMKKKQIINNDYHCVMFWGWMDKVNYNMYEKKIEQLDLQMGVRYLKKYKRQVFI